MTKVARARGQKRFSRAFWIESVAGSFTGFLAILTLVWRDWIEGVFGYGPDHHNGSFEWELVIVCAVLTLIFAALARREWRQARSLVAAGIRR